MAQSSVPAFKARLLSELEARGGLTNVQITWGIPAGQLQKELILLGDVDGDQVTAAFGQKRRNEDYQLSILISVLRSKGEQRKATERAYALAAEIETELRDDPSVGGTVRVAQVKGPFDLRERTQGNECEAALTITVSCDQRV